MSWWAVGGTRLEFESISWMLMAHCRIANQGRSSSSTASILTLLNPSRRTFWVTYILGTFWGSPWITLCLRQLQGIKSLNSYEYVSLCGPKESIQHVSRGSQLPPSTLWSIFLWNKCLRRSASLWCHSGGTFRQLSVFQKGCYCYQYLFDKKMQKICILSTSFHSTLVVYPHWNNRSRFPQGHCSRDAAECSSAEQGYKDLTLKNSQYMQTESKSWKRTTVLSVFIVTE